MEIPNGCEQSIFHLMKGRYHIYIYNSVLTRRHRYSNSSVSTPPNATKIAEMKVSQPGLVIVGPELLFSIYKCFFFSLFARGSDAKRMRAELTLPQSTDLQDGGGASMFHGHHFIEVRSSTIVYEIPYISRL